MTSGLVLGVDGGATKTVALLAGPDGRVIGWGRSGNADIYHTPHAERNVAQAIVAACAMAGAAPDAIASAVLSLVGADWPEDIAHWRASAPALRLGHLAADRLAVVNDAIGAMAAGVPTGPAVAVVCGSGTAVGARGPNGETWHSSFWQRRHSAVELTRIALDAIYEAELGIVPATALTAAALAHYDVSCVADLLHMHSARNTTPSREPGSFAPRLLDAAEAGDAVALGIVTAQAAALAPYAAVAARRVGLQPAAQVTLLLGGGLFRHTFTLLRDAVIQALRDHHPDLAILTTAPEPVTGALAIAQGQIDPDAPARLRGAVLATLPPPAIFATDHTLGT